MNYDPKGHKGEILKILMAGQTLTRKDAVQLFDCYNLSQRVGELIRMGYPIKKYKPNTPTAYSTYWIEPSDIAILKLQQA